MKANPASSGTGVRSIRADAPNISADPQERRNRPPPIADNVKRCGPVGASLRALFLAPRSPREFDAYAEESIATFDNALVDLAGRSRLRLQENAYELLAARDMLHESSESLASASAAAEEASSAVSKAQEALAEAVVARKNIDAALDVVSRTRALVRMYARAEDMTASRRSHTAARTLERLEQSIAAAPEQSVLSDLVPPSEPLRGDILVNARRSLRLWLTSVISETSLVGGRALSFARRTAKAMHGTRVDPDDASINVGSEAGYVSIPLKALPVEDQWIPAVLDDERGVDVASITSSRFLNVAKSPDSSSHGSPGQRDVPSNGITSRTSYQTQPVSDRQTLTRIPMRFLLNSVLACRDLGRVDAFFVEYQRERAKQLEHGVESILEEYRSGAIPTEESSAVPIAHPCVDRHVRLATFVAGFFVVDCAAERYSMTSLLSSDARIAMWKYACAKVNESAADTADVDFEGMKRIRATQSAFVSLAQLYGFENQASVP